MELKITNKNQFLQGIKQKVINEELPKILNRKKGSLKKDILKAFLDYLSEHRVVRGILGDYANDEQYDLQAIFGLTESMAQTSVSFLYELVEEKLNITYEVVNGLIIIKIGLDGDIDDFFAAETEYSYYSQKHKEEINIPWGHWLFNGAETEASLTFDVETYKGGKFSRSGRALMTTEDKSGWVFDPRSVTDTGDLFQDILTEKGFAARIKESIGEAIKESLNV